MRRGGIALAITGLAVIALPTSASPADVGVGFHSLTQSQTKILRAGKVKLSAEGRGVAEFAAYTKRRGTKRKRITDARTVRLHQEPRVVRLPLTIRGRKRGSRCRPRLLVVSGIVSGRNVELHTSERDPLVIDSPSCSGSERDYALVPPGDATHTNGTPRDLGVTGTAADRVRLALFACDNVSATGPELTFAATGGLADRGSPAGWFNEVEGSATTGAPQEAGPLDAGSGDLDFTITGADGCAAPIAFRDRNGNGALDVGAGGVPTERYGGGGETTFEPQGVPFQDPGRCDPLDPAVCLQPFPNDHFTVADRPRTPAGASPSPAPPCRGRTWASP